MEQINMDQIKAFDTHEEMEAYLEQSRQSLLAATHPYQKRLTHGDYFLNFAYLDESLPIFGRVQTLAEYLVGEVFEVARTFKESATKIVAHMLAEDGIEDISHPRLLMWAYRFADEFVIKISEDFRESEGAAHDMHLEVWQSGWRFVHACSDQVVDGELGTSNVAHLIRIHEMCYQDAKALNWNPKALASRIWFTDLVKAGARSQTQLMGKSEEIYEDMEAMLGSGKLPL